MERLLDILQGIINWPEGYKLIKIILILVLAYIIFEIMYIYAKKKWKDSKAFKLNIRSIRVIFYGTIFLLISWIMLEYYLWNTNRTLMIFIFGIIISAFMILSNGYDLYYKKEMKSGIISNSIAVWMFWWWITCFIVVAIYGYIQYLM